MNKLRYFLALCTLLLALGWSDVSKFIRHQMIDWKFRVSRLEANAAAPAPIETAPLESAAGAWDDAPGHTNDQYSSADYFDPQKLEAALVRMDSADRPQTLVWESLRDVRFTRKFNKEYDQYFDYPVFGKKVEALDGRKVKISGYMIPLDVGLYALSKNPYAACFFCGGAGPETIMALVFADTPKRYKTDDFVTLQGVFRLNSGNVDQFMYQLYAVEQVAK
jgi:hypothetical protein